MFTRDERRALLFLAVVAAAGGAIRVTRGSPSGAGAAAAVAPELPGQDLVAQAARSRRAEALQRPLEPGERVDVDRASAPELERLPRVGRRLAERIAADRRVRGPFGSLAGLGRVAGVGASLLRTLEPYVTFSGGPPAAAVVSPVSVFPPPARPATASSPGEDGARSRQDSCAAPVAINRATRDELMCLPGIGPVLAGRIVAEREAHGPFAESGDLKRVQGLGPTRIARLKGRITIP